MEKLDGLKQDGEITPVSLHYELNRHVIQRLATSVSKCTNAQSM
jgi:hypothetical protein